MDLFGFSTCSFFFHFVTFGLRPSGSGFDGSFWFFDLQLLFHFIAFGLRPSGLGFD